jgi:hypothetical protein
VYPLLTYLALLADPCGKTVKPIQEAKKTAIGTFAAFTLASAVFFTPPADAALPPAAFFSSSTTVSEKVLREGVYFDYEVDVQPQKYDDARSTFKPASETKSNKGTFVGRYSTWLVQSACLTLVRFAWMTAFREIHCTLGYFDCR